MQKILKVSKVEATEKVSPKSQNHYKQRKVKTGLAPSHKFNIQHESNTTDNVIDLGDNGVSDAERAHVEIVINSALETETRKDHVSDSCMKESAYDENVPTGRKKLRNQTERSDTSSRKLRRPKVKPGTKSNLENLSQKQTMAEFLQSKCSSGKEVKNKSDQPLDNSREKSMEALMDRYRRTIPDATIDMEKSNDPTTEKSNAMTANCGKKNELNALIDVEVSNHLLIVTS